MRWIFAFAALTLLVVLTLAHEELPPSVPERATLIGVGLMGRGIAVNPSEMMDFKVLRVGVGKVALPLRNLTENTTGSGDFETRCVNRTVGERCFPLLRIGVMFIDGEKYLLKRLDVTNESASGVLVQNRTEVGSFTMVKVRKGEHDVWVGTLNVSGASYFAYVLGVEHPLRMWREAGRELGKRCGPMEPPVAPAELKRCRQQGGRIVIERGADGCPLAPRCVNVTGCPQIREPTQGQIDACARRGGQMLGGVDENGCQLQKKCVLPSGETAEEGVG